MHKRFGLGSLNFDTKCFSLGGYSVKVPTPQFKPFVSESNSKCILVGCIICFKSFRNIIFYQDCPIHSVSDLRGGLGVSETEGHMKIIKKAFSVCLKMHFFIHISD